MFWGDQNVYDKAPHSGAGEDFTVTLTQWFPTFFVVATLFYNGQVTSDPSHHICIKRQLSFPNVVSMMLLTSLLLLQLPTLSVVPY